MVDKLLSIQLFCYGDLHNVSFAQNLLAHVYPDRERVALDCAVKNNGLIMFEDMVEMLFEDFLVSLRYQELADF